MIKTIYNILKWLYIGELEEYYDIVIYLLILVGLLPLLFYSISLVKSIL